MAIFTRPREDVDVAPEAPPARNGQAGGRLRARAAGRSLRRRWGWLVLAAIVAAGSLVGVEVAGGTSTYPVTAVFAQAPGLFPGASVDVLGVPVGTVNSVRNVGDEVLVGLAIDRGHPVPALARASLVSPEILGEPSIDLSPGYVGGSTLRAGATIPMSRTAVPVSTERVLKSLESMLKKVNPKAVGNLVTNLAQDLQGQGKNLNTLIAGAAGTLKLLATKADDLGQLSGSLAQLTGTLDSKSSQITQLITDYDTVSGVIAQHSSQLGGAVTQLSESSTQLIQLLVPDLAPVESDVGSVTRVGRTLDRNLTSVDETLSSATALFSGAERAYTPTYNWLTLNAQTPSGLTGAIVADLVRSRLEGVCRRILAHHATGLTAKQRQTLATCGNPSTSFFNPIIDEVPTVLNDISAGKVPTSTSPSKMLQQGLAKIPGASRSSGGSGTGSGSTTTPSSNGSTGGSGSTQGTPTPTKTTKTTKTTTTKKKTKTCLGGLLGGSVQCTTGSGTSTSGGTGSGGGGGLLSYDVRDTGAQSLTAAATRDLPPLPAAAPGATRSTVHRHHHTARHRARRGNGRARRASPLASASARGGRP